MEKIIFSADLHGNMSQYRNVLLHAQKSGAGIVIFGGDLTPKNPERRTPILQRQFLEEELFPLLKDFKEKSDIHVLFIMGNDDFRSNHTTMVDGQELYGYRMIDEIPYISKTGYTIVGYSYVPFTPFRYKCWERRDRKEDMDFSHRDDTLTEGVISQQGELIPYSLTEAFKLPSIAEDLENLTQNTQMEKLILITHAPPYGTVCDFNRQHKHVGSKGIRNFIEEQQPYATMHGHIHETVDLKGAYTEKLGRTFSMTVGNDHKPDAPYILEVELDTTPKVKRLSVNPT